MPTHSFAAMKNTHASESSHLINLSLFGGESAYLRDSFPQRNRILWEFSNKRSSYPHSRWSQYYLEVTPDTIVHWLHSAHERSFWYISILIQRLALASRLDQGTTSLPLVFHITNHRRWRIKSHIIPDASLRIIIYYVPYSSILVYFWTPDFGPFW